MWRVWVCHGLYIPKYGKRRLCPFEFENYSRAFNCNQPAYIKIKSFFDECQWLMKFMESSDKLSRYRIENLSIQIQVHKLCTLIE